MKTILKRLAISVITISVMVAGITCQLTVKPAVATPGWTTVTLPHDTGTHPNAHFYNSDPNKTWAQIMAGESVTVGYTNRTTVGYWGSTSGAGKFVEHWGGITINKASIGTGVEYGYLTLRLHIYSVTYQGSNPTFGVYTTKPVDERNYVAGDADNWDNPPNTNKILVSSVFNLTQVSDVGAGNWLEIQLYPRPELGSAWSWFTSNDDGDNLVPLYIMPTNHYYKYAPGWVSNRYSMFDFDAYTAGVTIDPEIVVTYATEAAERTPHEKTNNPVSTANLTASDRVNGIEWLTPRAAFSDEVLGFSINGSAAVPFTASVVDSSGVVIDTITDSIRTNGYYYWYVNPPDNTARWVRCLVQWANAPAVTSGSVTGKWGRIEPEPSSTEQLLQTYAQSDYYPQYDNSLSGYVVYKNGVGTSYWKSNLEAADMADYNMRFMAGGTYSVFDRSMEWLNDNIFLTTDSDNLYLAHWRYLMFSPFVSSPSFNDRDGFIIDVGRDYVLSTTGFWPSQIVDPSDNSSITWAHSADFYLNDISQGVSMGLDRSTYRPATDMIATVNVGSHSKVAQNLPNLSMMVFNDLGEVISDTVYGFVEVGVNQYSLAAPSDNGSYQVRFTFSGDDVSFYEYVHDLSFEVGGASIVPGEPPSEEGFAGWLDELLGRWGLNNKTGHWLALIVVLILITGIFGIYGKMPLVATVIDVIIFGFALYLGWVDQWVIALIAIGAGFAVYGLLKRKSEGVSRGGEPPEGL